MTRTEYVRYLVAQIPKGRVATYGQIAKMAGMRGARGIGSILHANPDPQTVPCHRVVNAQGRLAPGYAFGGPNAQRIRLEEEGVVMRTHNPNTIDLSTYGWNPSDALRSAS